MWHYLLRRLILLPITLFCIVLVNFIIINLAPGDPVSVRQIGGTGDAVRSAKQEVNFKTEDPYTLFREHYGLTLPILFNIWPWTSFEKINTQVQKLAHFSNDPEANVKEQTDLRILLGDEARFVMPKLLQLIEDTNEPKTNRAIAVKAFIRGGTRTAYLGAHLSDDQKLKNRKIAKDNSFLRTISENEPTRIRQWYEENKELYNFEPTTMQKIGEFFVDTRFFRYMTRVVTLDFGTLRNNDQKQVIEEVAKRFKYSLTLSIIPLLITFILCQCFGLIMAIYHERFPDVGLNFIFLIGYAVPIFIVAPFLIENVALHYHLPFSGFSSEEAVYVNENSLQRLQDISLHIMLPLIAILYGALAVQSRIARTAVLEVLRCDYVRTARAKGVSFFPLYIKHVGRNASITIVTSVAGSLGVILGGSLIIETLFQINGFGKFFYEAIINRDYNVMMFSALAGSFLSLLGYLAADIAYTLLDPRVSYD